MDFSVLEVTETETKTLIDFERSALRSVRCMWGSGKTLLLLLTSWIFTETSFSGAVIALKEGRRISRNSNSLDRSEWNTSDDVRTLRNSVVKMACPRSGRIYSSIFVSKLKLR
jgi:hypothetical protein